MKTRHAQRIRLGIESARYMMRWDDVSRVAGLDARRSSGAGAVYRHLRHLPVLSQRAALCYIRRRAFPELWSMGDHPESFTIRGVK